MVTTGISSEPTFDERDTVMDLLRTQATLYSTLESLSARQRTLVSEDDVTPLIALLADRQRVSGQLAAIAGKLAPVRRDWAGFRQRLTARQRGEADRLVHESGLRLKHIMEGDERDARVLSGRKQSVASTLRQTHEVGDAIRAYRVPEDGAPVSKRMDEGA